MDTSTIYVCMVKGKRIDDKDKVEAPIELWLKMASDITEFEQDYSSELAQVMSIAGSLEPHDPPRSNYQGDPDWNNVYQFITGLLKGDMSHFQRLSSIEAAVVLDLLQNLSDYLNSLDTSKQRTLMQKKFEQMKDNYQQFLETKEVEALTHGLDKDPLEEEIPRYAPKKASTSNTTSNTDSQATPSASTDTPGPGGEKPSDTGSSSGSKKSTLFSINPFSIPVKYLRPNLAE